MIAIGYCRRSKESTARTVSLEDQRARIEAYATEQGWTLVDVLTDDGISGGKRERLERVAERVTTTGAQRIVVYNLDRFARDVSALLDTLRAYNRRGVELHVVGRGKIDVDTANGFLVTGVEGLMAEHYRRLIGEKTKDALARLRLQGRRISGRLPYGYQLALDSHLVAEPYEQSILGLIATLRSQGCSLRAISRRLHEAGIVARSGAPFRPSTLARLVPNRTVRDIVSSTLAS